MTDSVLTPAIREEVGRLERADIMVGIPSSRNAATIGYVVRAAHAGLVQYFPDLRPVLVNADEGSADGTQQVVVETEPPDYIEEILLVRPTNRLRRVSITYPPVGGTGGKGAAIRTLFEIAAALEVQALVIVDSDLRSILPEWIELLAGPILKGGYDFVAPLYTRHKYDGTITNTLAYPLTRALYGHRIRQPIGGDVGISGDLVRHYLAVATESWNDNVSRFGIDIWMTTEALTAGFAVCQTRLGAKIHDPKDPGTDLGPMFREVVGTILAETARHADRWTGIHGSHDVPAYGFERIADPPPVRVDPVRLLGQFEAGASTFRETWSAMLAPATLKAVLGLAVTAAGVNLSARDWLNLDRGADVGRLDTATLAGAMATFHFPDDAWARVVYDLVVAARRGDRPVADLVAALVPIYFGRVASLIVEARQAGVDEMEGLVERQALAFERLKPELVARWTASGAGGATSAGPGTGASGGTGTSARAPAGGATSPGASAPAPAGGATSPGA